MHEMSLVKSLISQVRKIKNDNRAESVESVTVEIGPLSGVEAELVQEAYEKIINHANIGNASLNLREVPLEILCRECERSSVVKDLELHCSACSSRHVQITKGDEFRLIDVAIQIPVNTAENAK